MLAGSSRSFLRVPVSGTSPSSTSGPSARPTAIISRRGPRSLSSSDRSGAGPRRRRAAHRGLRALPAPGHVPASRGPPQAPGVRGSDLLGTAGAGLGRPGRPSRDCGTGPGGARRQPHRPHVHGRLERRLAVCGAAPLRVREPAHGARPRRRTAVARLLDHRLGPLRAAREQAAPGRADALPSLPDGRAGAAATAAGRRRAGPDRARRLPAGGRVVGATPRAGAAPVRAPGGHASARRHDADRVLSPEPAEYEHGEAHPRDVARGVSEREAAIAAAGGPLTSLRIRAAPRRPAPRPIAARPPYPGGGSRPDPRLVAGPRPAPARR